MDIAFTWNSSYERSDFKITATTNAYPGTLWERRRALLTSTVRYRFYYCHKTCTPRTCADHETHIFLNGFKFSLRNAAAVVIVFIHLNYPHRPHLGIVVIIYTHASLRSIIPRRRSLFIHEL